MYVEFIYLSHAIELGRLVTASTISNIPTYLPENKKESIILISLEVRLPTQKAYPRKTSLLITLF